MNILKITKFWILIIICSTFFLNQSEVFSKSKLKAKPKNKVKSSKISTKTKKSKKKKLVKLLPVFEVVKKEEFGSGIVYKNLIIGTTRLKHSIHVVEYDNTDTNYSLNVLKSKDLSSGLEKIHDKIHIHDSINQTQTIVGINANFWRAFSNRPIGATVVDGEVVEMNPYKEWTSGFFDNDNKLHLDNFKMSGKIVLKNGTEIQISHVNRRKDSLGLVLYNRFVNDTIPNSFEDKFQKIKEEKLNPPIDTVMYNDSTELDFDPNLMNTLLEVAEKSDQIENYMIKFRANYIDKPTINRNVRVVIDEVSNKPIIKNSKSIVLSFGKDIPTQYFPMVGDTITLRYNTNTHTTNGFIHAVCGTPRLVRSGVAKHEAYLEGSKGRRFINRNLPRTAIGTDKSGKKIFLVTIESDNGAKGTRGVSLQQLSNLMKRLGCYEAMNLDGGGSSAMVINNSNVMIKSRPDYTRKVSVAITISKKNK